MTTTTSPAIKRSSASNFCASLSGHHHLRAARQGAPGAAFTTRTFTRMPAFASNSNSVPTAGAAAIMIAADTGLANTAVTANGTFSRTVIAPAPAALVTYKAVPAISASATTTPYNAIASLP